MGANGTDTLSLDQIVDLLPDDFAPVEITDRRKQCASSAKGVVYLRSSQDFFPASWHVMFRYSTVEADASYFAIALGKRGILLIKTSQLQRLTSFYFRLSSILQKGGISTLTALTASHSLIDNA